MIAQPSHINRVLSLAITVLALAGCSSTAPVAEPAKGHSRVEPAGGHSVGPRAKRRSPGERAAAIALDQVGVPYRYGGSSPSGFDCSGLVQYSYTQAGVAVPRTTRQLWSAVDTVGRGDLRPGDLLFFNIEGKMSHVGMYLGGQRFVHAPQSGRTVSVASLESPFYKSALTRAGRPYQGTTGQ